MAVSSTTEEPLTGEPATPTDIPKPGWLTILRRSIQQFKHDDVTDRAAALTYYGVLAIFPGVLVLVSILGLLGKSTTQQVLNNLGQAAPSSVSSFLRTVIEQVQGNSGAASLGAIVGLVLALWSASGYVAGFMRRPMPSMRSTKDVRSGRPPRFDSSSPWRWS